MYEKKRKYVFDIDNENLCVKHVLSLSNILDFWSVKCSVNTKSF